MRSIGLAALLLSFAAGGGAQTSFPPNGCARGYPPDNCGEIPTVYVHADLLLLFDDPTNIGLDSSGNELHLDEVNEAGGEPPILGGGIGSYASSFDGVDDFASLADQADISGGPDVSWGIFGFHMTNQLAARGVWNKQGVAFDQDGDWRSFYNTTSNVVVCDLFDTVTRRAQTPTGTASSHQIHFIGCTYNGTSDEIEAWLDAVASGSPTSVPGEDADNAHDFEVGRYGTSYSFKFFSPVYWWRNASGGAVPTQAQITSIYNGGKGKSCSLLSSDDKVNMVHCWEWDPATGKFVDQLGSSDLTSNGSPLTAGGPGLVAQPTNANGYNGRHVSSGHLESPNSSHGLTFDQDADFSWSLWVSQDVFTTGVHYIFANGDDQANWRYGTRMAADQRYSCEVRNDTSGATATAMSVAYGWHHVLCTYTGSTKTISIFVDGAVPAGTPTAVLGAGGALADQILRVEDRGTVNDSGWYGAIDELAVFVGVAKTQAWAQEVVASRGP